MNANSAPVTEIYATKKGAELTMAFRDPKKGNGQKQPGIIFYHGGGWTKGRPSFGFYWAEMVALDGFVGFCPEYRLVGGKGETVADCLEDALTAWHWVVDHADRWNLDVNRLFVAGGSAGGHLAAMVAVQLVAEKKWPIPAGCVLLNPVIDTSTWPIFKSYPELNPMNRIIPGLPPILFLHGEKDAIAPIDAVRRYIAQAKQAGVDADLVAYPNEGHGFFNAWESSPPLADDLQLQTRQFPVSGASRGLNGILLP